MIEIERLTYRYPAATGPALDDAGLTIADGEFVVVAGDSGSGKTTIAHALVGLVPHMHGGTFTGHVRVAGRDTRDHKPRDLADVVGLVAQDPEAQAVVERVEDEIVFGMENLGVDPVVMRKRLEEVLDALGLAAVRTRRLDTLSGGERQRVAIGAVLAAQPRCLVLDEPTSQLDPQSAEDVLAAVHRLNTDLGLTVVLVEHRLERVVQHADRLVVLRKGRVIADGEPRQVLGEGVVETPLSRLSRSLGWEPLPLTIREGRRFAASRTRTAPQEPAARPAGDPVIAIRGLRVAFGGREVVRGAGFELRPGETLAIVGRNGSGKTTVLRAIMGLVRAHAGSRLVAGFDPEHTAVHELARRVAYVPQDAGSLLFHDTLREEVAFTLRARAPSTDVQASIEAAGLGAFADDQPRDLSAGERLRAALLAATAGDPPVLLLDEPTRGMDAAGKDVLCAELVRRRAAGCAVILVTHDVELVARAATRVLLLADGEVIVDGPVREVLGESALFSSQMNKVFDDRRILTVEDALDAVGAR